MFECIKKVLEKIFGNSNNNFRNTKKERNIDSKNKILSNIKSKNGDIKISNIKIDFGERRKDDKRN